MIKKVFIASFFLTVLGCSEDVPTPKPIGYHRIDFPEKKYDEFRLDCPFSFEVPSRSLIDTSTPSGKCWLNIHYPQYAATVHFTYNELNDTNLSLYLEESRKLAMKHTVRAENIEERLYEDPSRRVYGVAYSFEGNTATSYQFFLTDSNRHFVRGSLYFNLPPNEDSLKPIAQYIKTDLIHLIESFNWRQL